KFCRSLIDPFLRSRFFEKLTKRQVDFDRIELAGVIGKEFCLRELLRIELRFPTRIRPPGCAHKKVRHDLTQKLQRWIIPFERVFPRQRVDGILASSQTPSLPALQSSAPLPSPLLCRF